MTGVGEKKYASSTASVNELYKDPYASETFVKEKSFCGKYWKLLLVGIVGLLVGAGIVVAGVCGSGHCSSDAEELEESQCNLDCNDPKWGYTESDGAHCWAECYALCGGSSQSPINLNSGQAEGLTPSLPLTMTGYDVEQDFTITNNGHTVNFGLDSTSSHEYNISGLGLPATYRFAGFHFHWGGGSDRGSEHTVNSREYPMEVHFVHYSTNYADIGDAIDQPEGLAVLGFLFRVSSQDNPAFNDIVDTLDDIQFKDDTSFVMNLTLSSIMPSTFSEFYRYSGSLTTPACYESVVWTVFTDTFIEISEQQLEAFRTKLYIGSSADSGLLIDTFRPPLPLGSRTLYYGHQ